VNIPPGDEEMARLVSQLHSRLSNCLIVRSMCRDILNTCVRNTEDAEKAGMSGDATLGKKAAVWGMIEESELAKTIRGSFDKVQCRMSVARWSLTPPFSATILTRRG
jgi:protein phosphatase 1 regulatory subunit 37